jgi:hypothetical protein
MEGRKDKRTEGRTDGKGYIKEGRKGTIHQKKERWKE